MRFLPLCLSLLVLLPLSDGSAAPAARKKGGKKAPAETQSASPSPSSETKTSPPTSAPTAETPQAPQEEAPELPLDPQVWLKNSPLFQAGLKALQDEIPKLALLNFNKLLTQNPPKSTLPFILRVIGEAHIRQGDYKEGLQVLRRNEGVAAQAGALYWMGVADKNLQRYSTALRLFDAALLEKTLSVPEKEAIFWQMAEIHTLLGNQDLVRTLFQNLIESKEKKTHQRALISLAYWENIWKNHATSLELINLLLAEDIEQDSSLFFLASLLKSQALLSTQKEQEATELLKTLLTTKAPTPLLKDQALIILAEAEIAEEKKQTERLASSPESFDTSVPTPPAEASAHSPTAEDRLLFFIESEPQSALLGLAFDVLKKAQAFEDAQTLSRLISWANGPESPRTPWALYTLALLYEEKNQHIPLIALCKQAAKNYPETPLTLDILSLTLQHLIEEDYKEESLQELEQLLPKNSTQALFIQGLRDYKKGQFNPSAQLNKKVIEQSPSGDPLIQTALLNEGLSLLQAGKASELSALLEYPRAHKDTVALLALESALDAASRLDKEAGEKIALFIKQYPKHPRLADAYLAQAELALYEDTLNEELCLQSFIALSDLTLNEEQKERFMRLKIMLPEYAGQLPSAIQATKNYLDSYPAPELKEPMQLKLAELMYRQGEYNQTQLYLQNLLSTLSEKSPLRPAALFLCAKAAQQINTNDSLNTALRLFEEILQSPSPYTNSSHIERASLLMRQGRASEVITHLNVLFEKNPQLAGETRYLALALLAEAWSSLASQDNKALTKAHQLTSELLAERDLPQDWKLRTYYQRAQILEKNQDPTAALQDYYAILDLIPEAPDRKEWYWYYRSGFAALQLLENEKNWKAAIKLSLNLAQAGGPRAEEAKKRAERIRLENFVWDQN